MLARQVVQVSSNPIDLIRKYENLSVASGSSWITIGSFVMGDSSVSSLYIQFSGIDSAGNAGCWTIECAAKRGATASTAVVLNDTKYIFAKDVPAWDVRVQADTTAGAVIFQVLQDADNTSKWCVVTQISTIGGTVSGTTDEYEVALSGVDDIDLVAGDFIQLAVTPAVALTAVTDATLNHVSITKLGS